MLMLPRKKNQREAETKRKGRLFPRVKRRRSGGAEVGVAAPSWIPFHPSSRKIERVGEARDPSVSARRGLSSFHFPLIRQKTFA
ncbi:unnamed protein product [Urochloa humidicola]